MDVGLSKIGWQWQIAWWGGRRHLGCCSDRWFIQLRDVSKLIFRWVHFWMLKWKMQVRGFLPGTNNVSKCLPRWTTGIDGFASHSAKYEQSSSKPWRLRAHILWISGSTRPNGTLKLLYQIPTCCQHSDILKSILVDCSDLTFQWIFPYVKTH